MPIKIEIEHFQFLLAIISTIGSGVNMYLIQEVQRIDTNRACNFASRVNTLQ